MARIVVVGGGMGGLATALFSARRGHDVTVVDRDEGPPDGDADALAAWDRRGVAQAGFSHYFLARSTRVVREEAPDLLDELAAIGVGTSRVRFGAGFEDDRSLTSRRPVYEGVMRRFVQREPGVQVLVGSVRGLLASHADPHRIVGVRLADGSEHPADLVVDAAGRRSGSDRWLTDLGLDPPGVHDEPCHAHYLCQHYRLRDGQEYPSLQVPEVQPLPYGVVLVFIGDTRTFSLAVTVSSQDPLRRRLQDPAVLARVLAEIPMVTPWLERAEPIGELRVMAGLSNRRRRIVVDGCPVAKGIAVVGDASQYTNPALGQGVSLTFAMAQRLAEAVEQVEADPSAATIAYEDWVQTALGPSFERQLRVDRLTNVQWAAGLRGDGFLPPADDTSRYIAALQALLPHDDELQRIVMLVGHLLAPASTFWDDPPTRAKVEAFLADHPEPPPLGEGPLPRRTFEALVGA